MNQIDPAAVNALYSAIAELELIQAKIVGLSDRKDESWRRELVMLRRELQMQIQTTVDLLRSISLDSDRANNISYALGKVRSSVALHQANWPAVAIDRSDPDFRASVREIRTVSLEFRALADSELPKLRRN